MALDFYIHYWVISKGGVADCTPCTDVYFITESFNVIRGEAEGAGPALDFHQLRSSTCELCDAWLRDNRLRLARLQPREQDRDPCAGAGRGTVWRGRGRRRRIGTRCAQTEGATQ